MIVPVYYEKFHCLADHCRRSCCIGWELDLDDETWERYRRLPGDFGDRLRAAEEDIEEDGEIFHTFPLVNGRCPMLNERGLCDICLHEGEAALSVVCTEYPRYSVFFNGHLERTLSLSCEEVVRLHFENADAAAFIELPDDKGAAAYRTAPGEETADNGLGEALTAQVRDRVIAHLTDRDRPFARRLTEAVLYTAAVQKRLNEGGEPALAAMVPVLPVPAAGETCRISDGRVFDSRESDDNEDDVIAGGLEERLMILDETEALDEEWENYLTLMQSGTDAAGLRYLRSAYRDGQTGLGGEDLEKLAVYLVYRYFPRASADGNLYTKMTFAVFFLEVLGDMAAAFRAKEGRLPDRADSLEMVRVLSRQIEHSEDNIAVILEELLFDESDGPGDILVRWNV